MVYFYLLQLVHLNITFFCLIKWKRLVNLWVFIMKLILISVLSEEISVFGVFKWLQLIQCWCSYIGHLSLLIPVHTFNHRSSTIVACPAWCLSWHLSLGPPSCWIRSPVMCCWSTHWSWNSNATCSRFTDTLFNKTRGTTKDKWEKRNSHTKSSLTSCVCSCRDPGITFFDQMNQPVVMYR